VPKDNLAPVVGLDLIVGLQERVNEHVSVLGKGPVKVYLAVHIVDKGISGGKNSQKQSNMPPVRSRYQLPKMVKPDGLGKVEDQDKHEGHDYAQINKVFDKANKV